jgi:aminoglycoside phosphotransferase (APT) family kinase protein
MSEESNFDPIGQVMACEAYLSRSLGSQVRLLQTKPLAKSTRSAPWRLDVEVNGVMRSYVLRLDARFAEHEFAILRAMQSISIPTPNAYGWDPHGEAFGASCFFYDYIEGDTLLAPVLAGEPWAEQLYLDAVCALQSLTRQQLPALAGSLDDELTAQGTLEEAHAYFEVHPHPLAEAVSARLMESTPDFPPTRFSNGDLWLDNFIVRDRRLVGVIDFQHAGFSDPIYEFLLSFFVSPELRGRGIEERYCLRMGFDPSVLPWYHGLEYLDTFCYVVSSGKPFVHYTAKNLAEAMRGWLDDTRGRIF